jgi:RNA polymerase sigma factor (sigma-70 family)
MSEEDLLAYVRAARRAGDRPASAEAVAMLVWGFMENVRYRVMLKVPAEAAQEVADEVLASALKSELEGETVGEFRNWIGRIIQRRIADYHRDPRRQIKTAPLPTEHEGAEEIWGEEPSVVFEGETVELHRAIRKILDDMNPSHRRVVWLVVFEDAEPKQVAEETGNSVDNVHQIVSRFRARLDELLSEDDGNTPD